MSKAMVKALNLETAKFQKVRLQSVVEGNAADASSGGSEAGEQEEAPTYGDDM